MASEQGKSTGIALNVARTRVTVLAFNLTIISLMLSQKAAHRTTADGCAIAHLTSDVALYSGFCLTLLGLFWLLSSQHCDAEGLSRPWQFTLGAMTTYLALSQTVTAFMHEYLVDIKSAVEPSRLTIESSPSLVRLDVLGDTELLILVVMGGGVWVLTSYAGPLIAVLKSPVRGRRRWLFVAYCFAIHLPIYWVYASAWRQEYVPADQDTNLLKSFVVQFVQPLLWFR